MMRKHSRKHRAPDVELTLAKTMAQDSYEKAQQELHQARNLTGITRTVMGAVTESREKNHVREHLNRTFGGN